MSRPYLVFAYASILALPLVGQETRGMIFGRVVDPSGSPIADAGVTVRSTATNVATRLQTNSTGYYEASLLLSGAYEVTAESAGFKKSLRSGIPLSAGARLQVDVQLEIGAVTDSVTVSGEVPLLETNTVSSGRVIDVRNVAELPVARSNPIQLAAFTPGVQTRGDYRTNGHHAANILGAVIYLPNNVGGNEFLIDGVPNTGRNRRVATMPHTDALQEFKIETSGFEASIGHGTGVSFSMMTKAGTNQYHGAATWQHMQQRWNAVPFFLKQAYFRNIAQAAGAGDTARADALRSQHPLRSGRSNNYSGSIGGPVSIPKLINGRNKLFFFFNFNGTNERLTESTNNINNTIPTLANRNGDFSQLLQVDPTRYQIYDPLTVRTDPARPRNFIRTPFAGNILPRSRIVNPTYTKYNGFLPAPNNDPVNLTREPLLNYIATAMPWWFDYYALTNRIDYHQSEKHRFFVRWGWNSFLEDRSDWTYESARGLQRSDLLRANVSGTADWIYTMSGSTFLDVAFSVNQYKDGNKHAFPKTFKPTDVGLPAYLDQQAGDRTHIPVMNFAGYQALGRNFTTFNRGRTLALKADLSHVRQRHSLTAGFGTRQFFHTGGGSGNTAGSFSFTNDFTRRNDDLLTPAGNLGHSWAAFMMGLPNTMAIDTADDFATTSPVYSGYVQDNFRVTPKLTLTLGLRIEYERGMTERYNRMLTNFDSGAKLPITDGARAAYARSPIPELPAAGFNAVGGSLYAGQGPGRRRYWQDEVMWMPRLAAAYQLTTRTVLRAGYGMFYDTLNALRVGPNQFGYSRTTSTNLTNDFGVNWLVGDPARGVSPLTNPFPVRGDGTRYDTPLRDGLGLMAFAGRGYNYFDYNVKRARQQRWRVGVQQQFGASTVLEAAYAGGYSSRVPLTKPLNFLPEQYWSGGQQRNNAVASNLDSNVTNPFQLANFPELRSNPGLFQNLSALGFFTGGIIRKNQLLRPFPHMTGLSSAEANLGDARNHSLEFSVNRRFANSFTINSGYTWLSAEEADIFLNEYDPRPTSRKTIEGTPHRFFVTSLLEMPFGRGRRWLRSGPLSYVLGGFQLGVTYEYQTGRLLDFPNLFYYGNLQDIGKGTRSFERWFNTDNFERVAARTPTAYHQRVFPTRVDGVRGQSMNEWNLNAMKTIPISESVRLELRLDAINAFNRTIFTPPDTNPLSSNFGRITGQTETPNRYIQIQARFQF